MGESTHQPEYDCPLSAASVILVMQPFGEHSTAPADSFSVGAAPVLRHNESALARP